MAVNHAVLSLYAGENRGCGVPAIVGPGEAAGPTVGSREGGASEAHRPLLRPAPKTGQFDIWKTTLRHEVLARVTSFVTARCADELGACGVDVAGKILTEFVDGGNLAGTGAGSYKLD